MKKKTVIFPLILSVILPLAVGCTSKKSYKRMKSEDGEDVVIKIGEGDAAKYYTVNDLFEDLKSITNTPAKMFDTIEKVTVQAAQEITPEMNEIVNSKISDWVDSIKDEANASGTSYTALRKEKLTSLGYENLDEYRQDLIYEQQQIKLEKKFWTSANEESKIKEYIENRHPYHIKHIFVKLNDSASNLAEGSISATEAKKLGTVCRRIAESSFNAVANDSNYNDDYKDYSSVLGGAGIAGDLGIMDITSSVYPEFKLSTYLFDIYSRDDSGNSDKIYTQEDRREKLLDNDFADMPTPLDSIKLDYSNGFRSIDVSDCTYLANISDKDSWLKPDTIDELGLWRSDKQYARNVIFNNQFNFHDIGVITVGDHVLYNDKASTAKASNMMSFPNVIARSTSGIGSWNSPVAKTTRNILTDGTGNPIFFVRSESGVHFMAIEKSPFDAGAVEYFSDFNEPASTVAEKDLPFIHKGKRTSGTPKQYVAAKKEVITTRVKSYIKNEASSLGAIVTTGDVSTVESLNLYARIKLVRQYMSDAKVTIKDENLKNYFNTYITTYEDAQTFSEKLNRAETWVNYNKLIIRQNEVNNPDALHPAKQPLCMAYTDKQPSIYQGSCIYGGKPVPGADPEKDNKKDVSPEKSNYNYPLEIGSVPADHGGTR